MVNQTARFSTELQRWSNTANSLPCMRDSATNNRGDCPVEQLSEVRISLSAADAKELKGDLRITVPCLSGEKPKV